MGKIKKITEEINGTAGKKDNKTHREYGFTVSEKAESFTLLFSFSPKTVEKEEDLKEAFQNGIGNIDLSPDESLEMFRKEGFVLTNLLSVALYKGERYLGAAHRHKDMQEYHFTGNSSPDGFLRIGELKGEYRIILSFHGVFTDGLQYKLSVEEEYEKED